MGARRRAADGPQGCVRPCFRGHPLLRRQHAWAHRGEPVRPRLLHRHCAGAGCAGTSPGRARCAGRRGAPSGPASSRTTGHVSGEVRMSGRAPVAANEAGRGILGKPLLASWLETVSVLEGQRHGSSWAGARPGTQCRSTGGRTDRWNRAWSQRDMEKVEKRLSGRLRVLDTDNDGRISREELHEAIQVTSWHMGAPRGQAGDQLAHGGARGLERTQGCLDKREEPSYTARNPCDRGGVVHTGRDQGELGTTAQAKLGPCGPRGLPARPAKNGPGPPPAPFPPRRERDSYLRLLRSCSRRRFQRATWTSSSGF